VLGECSPRECLGTELLGSEPHLSRIASWPARAVTTIKAYTHQVSRRFRTASTR
jgi:hypothetical protein